MPEVEIAAVVPPAPGGSLREYVAFLEGCGETCYLPADGSQAWIQNLRGLLVRFPIERTEPVDPEELKAVLRLPGVKIASYLLEPDDEHPAVCLDYVCRNTEYHIDGLPSHGRRDIRRGLRRFTCRLCSWDELAEHGYDVHAETFARHGYAPPHPDGIRRYAEARRGTPFFDIWGAWDGDEMAAWMAVIKIDDWAIIHWANSRTSVLKNCPNNAILYLALRQLLAEEKRTFVTYGLSSIQATETHMGLHRYKMRMGFKATPMHRVFAPRLLLRPLLEPKIASWLWDRLEHLVPKSPIVHKIAGVSRIMSGRERTPLAWFEDKE